MSLTINTNVAAMVAQRQLSINTKSLQSSFQKLSSGYRINRAADDAAGLSISETLRTQIRGTEKAISNAQDGNNVLQIAEGALSSVTEHLQRIRELTVQAANDTNSTTERDAIVQEIRARLSDIDRIADSTRSNNTFLFDGSASVFALQIGANSTTADYIDIGSVFGSLYASNLSLVFSNMTTGSTFASASTIRVFLGDLDNALSTVNARRSSIGAIQNRLDTAIENLSITVENLSAAESRIRNVDFAKESQNFVKSQILQQSALSILAQANQAPSLALSLLGG